MELNAAGSWTAVIALMALVTLGGTALTAANSGMDELARGGVVGIVGVLVVAAVIIAMTARRIDDGKAPE